MKTLKETWIGLMTKIMKNPTYKVEDYIENLGENVTFSFKNYDELKSDKRIHADYLEMEKVFFSTQENIFGHSYGNTILTPYSSVTSPVEAICKILTKNPNTRKAVLTFVPYGEEKVPCISAIQFMLRDNNLNIFYTIRSQDVYRKFPCDAMCIASMGMEIAKQIGCELGSLTANLVSAHNYLQDIETAKNYCKN
ncbi:MAG: hypothetical protein J6K39_01600 [Clostridia bacterium]|nr:hypothetical protein [Clostridia bacterium]